MELFLPCCLWRRPELHQQIHQIQSHFGIHPYWLNATLNKWFIVVSAAQVSALRFSDNCHNFTYTSLAQHCTFVENYEKKFSTLCGFNWIFFVTIFTRKLWKNVPEIVFSQEHFAVLRQKMRIKCRKICRTFARPWIFTLGKINEGKFPIELCKSSPKVLHSIIYSQIQFIFSTIF